jgi:hypothetical protein
MSVQNRFDKCQQRNIENEAEKPRKKGEEK